MSWMYTMLFDDNIVEIGGQFSNFHLSSKFCGKFYNLLF